MYELLKKDGAARGQALYGAWDHRNSGIYERRDCSSH